VAGRSRKAGRKANARKATPARRPASKAAKAKRPGKTKSAARTAAPKKPARTKPTRARSAAKTAARGKVPVKAPGRVRVAPAARGSASMDGIRSAIADLAAEIARTRTDIAALRPQDIRDLHLQAASDELDAIVSATEDATQKILDVAEALGGIAGGLGAEASAKVTDAVTQLFEACSFQDITGQRVTRVVKSLKAIEAKVDGLMGALGLAPVASGAAQGTATKPMGPQADSAAPVDESELLNGPQLPGAGRTQDEIDAIMSKV
jgi:chemotaxis protein CheZ